MVYSSPNVNFPYKKVNLNEIEYKGSVSFKRLEEIRKSGIYREKIRSFLYFCTERNNEVVCVITFTKFLSLLDMF